MSNVNYNTQGWQHSHADSLYSSSGPSISSKSAPPPARPPASSFLEPSSSNFGTTLRPRFPLGPSSPSSAYATPSYDASRLSQLSHDPPPAINGSPVISSAGSVPSQTDWAGQDGSRQPCTNLAQNALGGQSVPRSSNGTWSAHNSFGQQGDGRQQPRPQPNRQYRYSNPRPRAVSRPTDSGDLARPLDAFSLNQADSQPSSPQRRSPRTNHGGYNRSEDNGASDGSPLQRPAFTKLDDGYKRRSSKYYSVGRVFLMMDDQPQGTTSDDRSSCWTYNSYGQPIHTKARRFIVVRAYFRSCLVVPITTYSGKGVAKEHVKKSDHCMAYSGKKLPCIQPKEQPMLGESGMQAIPVRIDLDDPTVRLDERSRIDLARPRTVEHYSVVKNVGKVHPNSEHALLSQFQSVLDPTLAPRMMPTCRPTALLSSSSIHVQAYSALLNHGFSQQMAADYVNRNVRATRAERAAAIVSSGDSEGGEGASQSDGGED